MSELNLKEAPSDILLRAFEKMLREELIALIQKDLQPEIEKAAAAALEGLQTQVRTYMDPMRANAIGELILSWDKSNRKPG